MGIALPVVMQDSHGQPGAGACISWLPACPFSTGACLPVCWFCQRPDEYFPSWLFMVVALGWLLIFFFWVFKENLQWLNQMWFFHPCLGHLHNESHAWDPWRSGTGKGIASVWCLSSLSPACCLFTYWVQPGMLVAIWNNLWLDDVLEEALLHWVLLWDQMGIVLPSGLAREA